MHAGWAPSPVVPWHAGGTDDGRGRAGETDGGEEEGRQAQEQESEGDGLQVRIAPDVVRMARVITPMKRVALTNYLSDILRPVVTRDYAQAARKLSLEGSEK
jgi:hypothetical protein